MSILLVEVLPQGIIFGADRNVTESETHRDYDKDEEVSTDGTEITKKIIHNYHWTEIVLGQSQRPKVLRWPQRKALLGYVGVATIGGVPTDEWLFDFIGEHINFTSFEALSDELSSSIERQRQIDEGDNSAESLKIHLAGFELREGFHVPLVRYIHNVSDDGKSSSKKYKSTEEFWKEFPKHHSNVDPRNVKTILGERASKYDPWWFHQGNDLTTFNYLEGFLKAAFKELCIHHPDHKLPTTLPDWERQVRMSILMYGAYFQAYKGPSEQYVGGGADTVYLEWPE